MSDHVSGAWRRNVILFLAGQTVSLFGSMIVQYVVMWHIALETRSGMTLGLFMLAAFAPQGVMSILGGVLADRMDRKRLIIAADTTIAAVTIALAILMTAGITDLWLILGAVAIRSLGAGVQTPTVQALIPQLAPTEQLMRVNGVFMTINSATALLAPAAGAAVYAWASLVSAFYLDAVTAVIGIGFLLLVTVPSSIRDLGDAPTYRRDLADGMRYIATNVVVRWLIVVLALLFVLTQAPAWVVSPLLIAENFGPEAWMLAVVQTASSVGTMLGGVLVSTALVNRSRAGLLIGAAYGIAVCTAALGLSPALWLFCLVTFLFGLAIPVFSAPFMTLIQQNVEPGMLGRVFSYVSIAMTLSTPTGVIVFGPLADAAGLRGILIGSGMLFAAVLSVAVALPSGRATLAAAKDTGLRDRR